MDRSNYDAMNRKPATTKKLPKPSLAISIIAMLTIALSSTASAGAKFTEVSEQQLSEIRGKFIARDHVRYFKLEMTTHWTDHKTFDHRAGLSVTVDIRDRDRPRASVTIAGTLGDRDDNSAVIENPIPASDNINGIAQTIQVEGSGNQIVNNIAIDALELPSDQSATADQSVAADTTTTDNLIVDSPQTYINADDTTTQFNLGDNNLGYAIETAANDVVVQKLSRNAALDAGQLVQSVAISNNFQHIVNNVRVQVAFDSLQATRTSALAIASQSLIGLR